VILQACSTVAAVFWVLGLWNGGGRLVMVVQWWHCCASEWLRSAHWRDSRLFRHSGCRPLISHSRAAILVDRCETGYSEYRGGECLIADGELGLEGCELVHELHVLGWRLFVWEWQAGSGRR
jgi:hypothetical protein